ncbi:MAG TPA: hypothetical protein VL574_17075 [Stellaceae bacterium]|nr:hypothetical protein [Stellaceae bacterium]
MNRHAMAMPRFFLSERISDFTLSCGSVGLMLAGVPLLKRRVDRFSPRSDDEIDCLLRHAYDLPAEAPSPAVSVRGGLAGVVQALNDGDMARAQVGAVLLKLPALDWVGAIHIVRADQLLTKNYNPEESRDWRGRWTNGGEAAADIATRPLARLADISDDLMALGGGTPRSVTTPKGAPQFILPNRMILRFDLQPGQYLNGQSPHINLHSPGGTNFHINLLP